MNSRFQIKLPRPHPGQQALLKGERRFNVACMGRRFGKSAFGVNRLVQYGYCKNQPVAWFAPQYKLLDEAWRETRRRLFRNITRADSQQHRLELKGGGIIDFWTLDNPDAGRGRKYALAVIDEAAMARNLEEAWTAAIRPTLADLQGKAWFLSTPKGGNYFKLLFDRAADNPDWARWQMPTSSNPYIKTSEIDAMKAELPSLIYQQEIVAQFIDLQGAVVKREWLQYEESPDGLPVVLGVDLAISVKSDADYSAIVAMSRDKAGTIYIRDAQRIRAPFHQVLQFIQQLAAKWRPITIAIEQVQYQAAVVQELARTTNLPVRGVHPDKDKLTRFLPLLARYEQGLVRHAPGLQGWFEEELLSFPVGPHDDGVDALAYAFAASTPLADYYPPNFAAPTRPARTGRF
jgi:predicted phage terminase large subunit-like protein